MPVFFTNLCFMASQVRYLVLFLLFLVIDNFEWFWMESQSENKIWSVNRMLHEKLEHVKLRAIKIYCN